MAQQNGFDVSCPDAARIIGVTGQTLIRQAKMGLVPHRLKGNGDRLRYYFRAADVEKLRRQYQEGFAPANAG